MTIFEKFFRPAFFLLDAERAHRFAINLLKANLVPPARTNYEPALGTVVWGQKFNNPIGLAAGFDKNATATNNLCKLGFGFIETGTATPRAQAGNPRPRLFRLSEDDAIINRLGFNNEGIEPYSKRLKEIKRKALTTVIGSNIGRNKDSTDAILDYVKGVRSVGEYSDYIVVNVSSPNTSGLRELQNKNSLEKLLAAVVEEREKLSLRPPIVLKIFGNHKTTKGDGFSTAYQSFLTLSGNYSMHFIQPLA